MSSHWTPPPNCGSPHGHITHVDRRDRKLAGAAQARFARVLALAREVEPPADDPEREAEFRRAWAMAMIYRVDQQYEQWLALEPPEGLDFHVEEELKRSKVPSLEQKWRAQIKKQAASKVRLDEFIASKTRTAEELLVLYARLDETQSREWMLTAAARQATVLHHFANQLFRPPLPQAFERYGPRYRAYCQTLAARAEPLRDRAIAAYEVCLARATEYQLGNELARMCEEELENLDGARHPATHELFGGANVTTSRFDSVGVLAEP